MKTSKLTALVSAAIVALAGMAIGPLAPRQTQALEKRVVQAATKASVQLGPLILAKTKGGKNEIRPFGWGSGTLLEGGYILTNHHVTDTDSLKRELRNKPGFSIVDGRLLVFMTKRTDEPPVPTYIAEVIVDSEALDLAVLRIAYDLSGEEVDASELNLPSLPLGDSDTLEIGDNLNIFGYPGIGGETITFTSGPVSGFTTERGTARAWIKTSASISGGNSGGTGVNDDGELIGVPTQGGSGDEKAGIVDCRPVSDTNGDGRIDKTDSCVAIGGFINALRSINMAKPLIEQARGESPASPGNDEPVSDGVFFSGKIVDGNTGRAISNAYFIVFKEGIALDDVTGSEDEILVAAQTDRSGKFTTSEPIQRNTKYAMAWLAKGYKPASEADVSVGDNSPETIEVTLKLYKK
jgi:S1-C subfamily serine protease